MKEEFPSADARSHEELDVTAPALDYRPDLVLHGAAWTDVDRAEQEPAAAAAVNVGGDRTNRRSRRAVVYFHRVRLRRNQGTPYVESDVPNPLNEYGHSKLAGERQIAAGWIEGTCWLFGPTGRNFVRTMLARSAERDEVRVVADQLGSPTYVGHLATATKSVVGLPPGLWHVAADGQCTWAEFAAAIFEEAGAHCRVVPISSKELNQPAPRPAYSVLRSERPEAPRLPYWREGLRDCLARL